MAPDADALRATLLNCTLKPSPEDAWPIGVPPNAG
jgi:hypothetical protein